MAPRSISQRMQARSITCFSPAKDHQRLAAFSRGPFLFMLMMLSRSIKSVDIDFEWPLNKTWKGYVVPEELELPTCPACKGQGWSARYIELREQWHEKYDYQTGQRVAGKNDNLTQQEVDHLLAVGCLKIRQADPTDPRGKLVTVPRTADEVNHETRANTLGGNGAKSSEQYHLNLWQCEQEGVSPYCNTCKGKGDVGSEEQREKVNAWKSYEPPFGTGIQMWESVSDGSPITPVFENTAVGRRDMAKWLMQTKAYLPGNKNPTLQDWMMIINDAATAVDIVSGELR